MGRLINKVTLSLYDHAVSKARCEGNGPVLGEQRNAGGGVVVQTRGASRTAASAALPYLSSGPLGENIAI